MSTDKLKKLQSIVKTDKLIMAEIKKLIGTRICDLEELSTLKNRLQYSQTEEMLSNLKKSLFFGSNLTDADKIAKVEKEIKKIQTDDFEVCVFINSAFRGQTIKKSKSIAIPIINKQILIPWKTPNIDLINADFRHGLSKIENEKIPVVLDKDSVVDLTKMPHLLVAGQTGSGKSVFLNTFITTVLYRVSPEVCKLVLIDPKRVEFSLFKNVPHLWRPVATQLEQIENVLDELIIEMERRYTELEKMDARNIESFNRQIKEKIPYIVVVIDELADLMMVSGHGVETQITRLVQLARAVGIHVIMATQRPVVEIMTGLIKANMPSRIAFQVSSKQDSRVILDRNGAENLKGCGDMLFLQAGKLERHQGVFISEEEIKKVVMKR
jgi:hypothetical protein